MLYDFPLYRPPSEARSLILQVTLGCSHNRCLFCSMYKTKRFRVKSPAEIQEHIMTAKKHYPNATQIFLADGNVMAMETQRLIALIGSLYQEFPQLKRINAYAGPLDLIEKTDDELKAIREAGLYMLYLGVESGSKEVLRKMKKGVDDEEMITAGLKAKLAGFRLSCTIISGLGGKELRKEHAAESARVINSINPDYLALLTLLVEENAPLIKRIENKEFQLLSPWEVLEETEMMIQRLELENCIFRSNHPSNYLSLSGELGRDKDRLLKEILQAKNQGEKALRSEDWRIL